MRNFSFKHKAHEKFYYYRGKMLKDFNAWITAYPTIIPLDSAFFNFRVCLRCDWYGIREKHQLEYEIQRNTSLVLCTSACRRITDSLSLQSNT